MYLSKMECVNRTHTLTLISSPNPKPMKTPSLLFSLIAGVLLLSCGQKNSNNVIDIDGHKVHFIDIREVSDTIAKSLSDFIADVSFVKLETNEESVISSGKWLAGERYILIFIQKNGLLQFSRDGKFIRKLVSVGEGPQEISAYRAPATIYNDNRLIVQSGRNRSYLLHINLDTGEFLDNIPVSLKGPLVNIEVRDSIIFCAPFVGAGENGRYYMFSQSFSGDIIDTIPAPPLPLRNNYADLLIKVGNKFHYHPVNSDTLFKINGDVLEPYYIFHTGRTTEDMRAKVGDISFVITSETKAYFIIRKYTITKVERFDNGNGRTGVMTNGSVQYIFVDKNRGSASVIYPDLRNDFLGKQFEFMPNAVFNSEHFLMEISAISLLKIVKQIKENKDIIVKSREQLISVGKDVSEEDNPILLIGRVK